MATLAHRTADTLASRGTPGAMRAALERALDDAPTELPRPRGWLRRLFARDRSARALVGRYRLWPAMEHAYTRVTREYGPVRVEIAVRENFFGEPCVWMEFHGDMPDLEAVLEYESVVMRELWDVLGRRGRHRLYVDIEPDRRGDR